jgi:hypothetical protein
VYVVSREDYQRYCQTIGSSADSANFCR